uniref:Uncharacterized protein n=1 Tax=Panagrolaimus davidi TaxID=227884 RepID=A0A914Q713_9BILA
MIQIAETLLQMIHPPSSFQCKTYHDCIGFHGPLPKGSVSVRYECNKGQCSVSGNIEENCTSHIDCPFPQYCQNGKCHPWIFEPLHKPTTTTQKPLECKVDSDCYQSGVVCGGGRYCKNGECHNRHFSIPLPILLAETRKPCKDDSGCYGHSILCGIPHHCESSYCVTSQSSAVPVTPEIHSDTTLLPLTVLPHTKKECKKDHDCARYGRHPFYFPQYYCDHGICKRGIRPAIATQNPHEPVTEVVLPQTTAQHSKHCKEDFECNPLQKIYLPLALRQYCDNGICKHGVRPDIATPIPHEPVTEVVIPTKKYPKHPKHCKKDHDCRDKSKMLTYCDNGVCKHGRRPKISTIAPTQQQPTTEIIVPQTPTSGAQICQKDRDCVKLIGFQHKTLVSVYCHEGHCALKPQENDATTTLALESSTNKPASVEPPLSLVTVKPLESHSTHKPAKTCKHDTDCHNPKPKHHTKEHYFQKQCIKGKCVLAPRHPKNTTTHGHGHTIKPHVHHIPTTKAPHTHQYVTEEEQDLVLRTTESHEIGPEIPASTTPHVYTCRRNRDCADYPHPKDMPVYCEHRLCKHGHRRPKNDFDSCKSHQDCSEGPCVEGFCTVSVFFKF